MTVIDKPGFYTSKAGKCEVVAIKDGFAFGFILGDDHPSWRARIWYASDGCTTEWPPESRIIGPWTDKPKPIEGFAVQWHDEDWTYYGTKAEAEEAFAIAGKIRKGRITPRLVHLIEAEDRT